LGLLPNTEVEFVVDGEGVRIVRARADARSLGRRIVEHMRGRGTARMTTDQIMQLTRG
jgi:hypothetical protein